MHSTYLLNLKVSYPDREAPSLWKTEQLKGWSWNDRYSVHADGISITLSPDSNSYLIKSSIEGSVQIDLKIGRVAPGFKVGSDGTSYFGTDPKKPWGTVKHAFWPRAFAEGTVTTTKGRINVKDRALYVFALQGMKPHFAAAQWNFLNFQGPKYSAVLMEFTTPASYGETKVAVGGIVTDEAILCVDGNCTTSRTDPQRDPTTDWDEPGGFLFHLKAATPGGAKVDATLNHKVESRLDRIDVLANLPGVVKKIIQGVAKTKPYLYQVCLNRCSSIYVPLFER